MPQKRHAKGVDFSVMHRPKIAKHQQMQADENSLENRGREAWSGWVDDDSRSEESLSANQLRSHCGKR